MIKTLIFSICIFAFLIYLFPSIVEDSDEIGQNPLAALSTFLKSNTNQANPKIGGWTGSKPNSEIIDFTNKKSKQIGDLNLNSGDLSNKVNIDLVLTCSQNGVYVSGLTPSGYFKPQLFSEFSYKTYQNLDQFYTELDWDQINQIKNKSTLSLAYYDKQGNQFINNYKISKDYFQYVNNCYQKQEKVK